MCDRAFYADKLIATEPAQDRLLHLLARAARARVAVEFGSSIGVSTIYLAAAVRENGGGVVVATEMGSAKVVAARASWQEGGVDHLIGLREGDARETLRQFDRTPTDMLLLLLLLPLLDGWPDQALAVLRLVEPHPREGGAVTLDNASQCRGDLAELIIHLTKSNVLLL